RRCGVDRRRRRLGRRADNGGRGRGRGLAAGLRLGLLRIGGHPRGRLGRVLRSLVLGLFGHSGGSSSKRRFQINVAIRVEATVASAPVPARRPDQINLLTKGLSVIGADSIRLTHSYPSSPRQIVSTISVFAWSSSGAVTGSLSKIHPLSTCSTQP